MKPHATSIRPTPEVMPLVAILGDAATLDLLEHYAGTRVALPMRVTERCALARAIGVEPARALQRMYGATQLYVPLAKRWRIQHLRARGLSYSAIARTVGCNEAQVHRTLADHGMTGQMALSL